MEICKSCLSISEKDLRAARKELKIYVDIAEEDLMKIYVLAVRHARLRHSAAIPVASVMTRKVFYVSAGTDIRKAAGLLTINHISGMPVVDDENRVIGVISEADIESPVGGKKKQSLLTRVFQHRGAAGGNALVGDVMSSPPITTLTDADIKEVATILDMRSIKRLPVVDDEGKLVGIVSRGDIVRTVGTRYPRDEDSRLSRNR
jgi:CBS domain-containing protein